MPHFLYEGDRLEVAATITNSSSHELTGQAILQLTDATSNISVDGWFQNVFPVQYFTVATGNSEVVRFPIEVPYLFKKTLRWQIAAHAENSSDSTSAIIPVLTNKALVTETLQLPIQSGVRNYSFEKLLQADPITEHHSLTLELFQNTIWHVAQALPGLIDTSNENAVSVWNQFYAYALAQKISELSPQIKQTINAWKNSDTIKDQISLQTHEKLSTIIQDEPLCGPDATSKVKQTIATLFDTSALQANQKNNLRKLKSLQHSNGSFSWYGNMPDDRFITQSIVTGMGFLKRSGALTSTPEDVMAMLKPALSYLDQMLAADYKTLLKEKEDLKKKQIRPEQIQYLYLRSFFTDIAISSATLPAHQFYQNQARQFWSAENHLLQALIALALHRNGDAKTSAAILQSLKKAATGTPQEKYLWQWWQNPAEEKAALAEAFYEIKKDTAMVLLLQAALLSEKGLNNWQTANATAAACYTLLVLPRPSVEKAKVQIKTGHITFSNTAKKEEWETGYFSETIEASRIKPDMGTIQITAAQSTGAVLPWELFPVTMHWRYFQNSDAATATHTGVKIKKQLFVKRAAKSVPVNETTPLHLADTITVQLTITSAKRLHHVQIRDGHAAALTPLNNIKGHHEQGQPGYYQKQRSISTDFFLSFLQSGTSVLKYSLLVTHAGTFSTGAATVQSLYLSGTLAHSEALRIQVE